ncbi:MULTISPECIES: hypothetical protein [unclassified Nocardia]|uniref:hypothetical protein n=1 Tax=unclassified Nocardia TaxID=2637762 RepID=UPI0033B690EC
MPNDTLIVPVEVAAFAVNARTRDADGSYVIQRWISNFVPFVDDNAAPEPAPFAGSETWTGEASRLGVYLHWQLPEALSEGLQDEETGEVGDFPLVPNRWLVVRRSDGGVRTWIVHSDYLDSREGSVSYLDPTTDTPTATKIGRRVDLTTGSAWQEPGGEQFLTAVGPGLLTFSVFQPYNKNVFSVHDTLDDLSPGTDDRLSYFVAGWYSDPDSDILTVGDHAGERFADLMSRLEWQLAATFGEPRRSVYTGSALGIDWRPTGGVYPSASPHANEIAVAIGNSAGEAAGELQEQSGGSNALSEKDAQLYRAFALGVLDEYDRADGELFPERAAHDSGFGPVPGGFVWRSVDRAGEEARAALSESERAADQRLAAEVTADLNGRQRELDGLERELAGAQQRLYVLWALSCDPNPPQDYAPGILRQLDPARENSVAWRVTQLSGQVAALRDDIPWDTTADGLAAKARAYAAEHGLRTGLELQRVPLAPFEQHADPVLMLQGANLSAPLTRGSDLPCRVEERLVTEIGAITADTVAAEVAEVNVTGLPGPMAKLVTEFLIIDQARKTGASLTDPTGTLPEYGTGPWAQPWQPLYLQWEVEYTAIPFVEAGQERFSFDGDYYRWEGEGTLRPAVTLSGRQVLMPTSGYDQDGQLDSYADGRTDLRADLLAALREQLNNLDQLSQRLDGLSTAVGQRLSMVNRAPTGDLAGLIGTGVGASPDGGGRPVFDWDDWPESDFQELRSGQLLFIRLSVVDRFGRAVDLIDNPLYFDQLRKPEYMTPKHAVGEVQVDRYVELGPRLLQPARLRFDFLSARSDDDAELIPGANPVCAWLIHNRLDRAIAVYDPEGRALGDLRRVLSPSGGQIVAWTALPGSPVAEFDDLAAEYPHAHRYLAVIVQKGPDVLDAVRDLIDRTLASIDPDGPEDYSLGFLLGRPLALVRARLDLELCGPVRTDVTWPRVVNPPAPQMPSYRWNVRLGEARQTDDGLIGCVIDDDYEHFETVLDDPAASGGYLRPIDIGERLKLAFDGDSNATVTLLLDPRAAVHATTDILPVSSVVVPQRFTDTALAAMAVNFRAGPLLIARTEAGAVTLPQPTTATGTWSWTEAVGAEWSEFPIVVPDPASLPVGIDPEIRSGFLVLEDAAQYSRTSNERGAR